MLVRYVRKVRLKKGFISFKILWGPGNNGKTGKTCKISYIGYKLSFFQKLTPSNVGKICKKGKI
jgi:hypothetical protein